MAEQIVNFFVELFKNRIPEELTIFIISLFPILEIRGGMIAARILEVDFLRAFIICYIGNMLPIPFILLFIRKIFKFLRRFEFMHKILDRLEAKGEKNREKVLRYKAWGLLAFVAIPLPGTGGWTGALIAALLDLRMKKALPIIALGVFIAGLIMSLLTYGIFQI
ncbi:MAG: small multi-drug export protein [Clostridiales bacterium]|nr:small multi-drug export protein [Clostridia bacterium]MCR4563349.1 small multi-drug export protein [Clostridiales bacterium]